MKHRNVLFGYRYQGGVIVPNPEESGIVRELFEAYCSGQSLRLLVLSLTERSVAYQEGITTWNKGRLKRLLEEERYTGQEGYPPLISAEVYQAAQTVKEERRTKTKQAAPSPVLRLRVPVLCPCCGTPMRRKHFDNMKPKERWYCRAEGCGGQAAIADERLMSQLTHLLRQVVGEMGRTSPPSTPAAQAEALYSPLNPANSDKQLLKQQALRWAEQKYEQLNMMSIITKRIVQKVSEADASPNFAPELCNEVIQEIYLIGSHIAILLINGQRIAEEGQTWQEP